MNDDTSRGSSNGDKLSENENHEFALALSKLEERCKKADIEIRESDLFEEKRLFVELPAGREKRSFVLWPDSQIKALLSIPFEEYTFLGDYEAICSYSKGSIEALVSPLNRIAGAFIRRRLLGKRMLSDLEDEEEVNIELHAGSGENVVISLRPPSKALRTLARVRHTMRFPLSFNIHGIQVKQHDDALKTLTRLANSFFFQVDLECEIQLTLSRTRRRIPRGLRKSKTSPVDGNLVFPKAEYDEEPISLYWYAQSAQGMPLLQFLAYYQVIEFYFPTYFRVDARRKIRGILKNPTFRPERDTDIGRILQAIVSGGGSVGDERSMIKVTLQETIDPDALRDFLTSDKEMAEFFSHKAKGLTSKKLSLTSSTADLRNEVAERIYEIRCRIVHTKEYGQERDGRPLLPFSKEVERLHYDVALAEYLAQQVLIEASTPFRP